MLGESRALERQRKPLLSGSCRALRSRARFKHREIVKDTLCIYRLVLQLMACACGMRRVAEPALLSRLYVECLWMRGSIHAAREACVVNQRELANSTREIARFTPDGIILQTGSYASLSERETAKSSLFGNCRWISPVTKRAEQGTGRGSISWGKIVTFPKKRISEDSRCRFPAHEYQAFRLTPRANMPAEFETENRKVQRFRNIIREASFLLSLSFSEGIFTRQSRGSLSERKSNEKRGGQTPSRPFAQDGTIGTTASRFDYSGRAGVANVTRTSRRPRPRSVATIGHSSSDIYPYVCN